MTQKPMMLWVEVGKSAWVLVGVWQWIAPFNSLLDMIRNIPHFWNFSSTPKRLTNGCCEKFALVIKSVNFGSRAKCRAVSWLDTEVGISVQRLIPTSSAEDLKF
jgi:hypothetical protein